jgi:hypothetical protein
MRTSEKTHYVKFVNNHHPLPWYQYQVHPKAERSGAASWRIPTARGKIIETEL